MTEIEIYGQCLKLGMTPAGAAGATANILAESAGRPNNVEDRSGIADDRYTAMVDNRTYGNFTTDAFGYGLCQWTSRNRKKDLLDYAQGHGVSIGDASMQFQFMAREMRNGYSYVWSTLTHSTDPYEAGYLMCKFYEIPANTEAQSQYRGNQARGIYDRCSGMTPVDPVEPDEPTTESYWPPRMICKGMNGADVTVLQALLVARGYTVNATNGVFDDSTDKACRRFQSAAGIAVDGIAGPNTWTAILRR
jgi:hypothetical protein